MRHETLPGDENAIVEYLASLIRKREFALDEASLAALQSQGSELIQGWAFAYRVYRSIDNCRTELLREGLASSNPRVREQSCDIIGDEEIVSLRESLIPLFEDPVPYVREAATYNHDNMFPSLSG